MMLVGPTHYRFTYYVYSGNDVSIRVHEYAVAAETKNGYWIVPMDTWLAWGGISKNTDPEIVKTYKAIRKWVPKTSFRRFAYPSIEEARTSFLARCRKHILILQNKIPNVQKAAEKAKGYVYPPVIYTLKTQNRVLQYKN